jgi:hypothetical protein
MAFLGGDQPTTEVLHEHGVSSCDKCLSNIPCLQLPLTVRAGHVTINILPDDVLLHIFFFDRERYFEDADRRPVIHLFWKWHSWRWHRLVHVCRRWRSVVFGSPKFLDLRLVCGPRTRVKRTGIWPPFPIILTDAVHPPIPRDYDFDAAIVDPSRVCEISLRLTRSQLQQLVSAMQEQCPELMHLKLDFAHFYSYPDPAPALSDGFLGGSALRLQTLELHSIPFPALPELLLSATELVRLTLLNIPPAGYFSPEVIVTSLAVLVNLRSLTVEFSFSRSRPDRERPPPPLVHTILPALTRFQFLGVMDYLEDLVARIDAPFLDSISVTFFRRPTFDAPQLIQFMRRTTTSLAQMVNEAPANTAYFGVQADSVFSQT